MTAAPPPQPLYAPPPPSTGRRIPPEIGEALRSGWGRAALAAAIVFLLLYAVSAVFALAQQAYGPGAFQVGRDAMDVRAPLADVPQAALASLFMWHGASLGMEIGAPGAPVPIGIDVSVSFALILGTFLVVVALFHAGRRLGRSPPLAPWLQPIRGLQIAIPYALLGALLSPLGRFGGAIPGIPPAAGTGGDVAAQVSPAGVVAMTFLLAAVAAGSGAVGVTAGTIGGVLRRAAGAFAGAWRMLWLTVALAVVGFLVVAAVHPDVTRSYLQFVSQDGPLGMVRGAIVTVFLLGNVGVYVGAAAAGAGLGFSGLGGSCTLLSYRSFPRGVTEAPVGGDVFADPCATLPLDLAPAPVAYLLFLAVPVVATVMGGRLAAARSAARGAAEGAAVGAAAAVPFAFLFVFFAGLADLSYDVRAIVQVEAAMGPAILPLFFLALLWGGAGGALGGWLRARTAPAGGPDPGAANGNGPGRFPEPVDPSGA